MGRRTRERRASENPNGRAGRIRRALSAILVVAAASLVIGPGQAKAALFPAVPSTLGAIPDGGPSCPQYGAARVLQFQVSGIERPLSKVELTLSFSPVHNWAGDIDAVLTAPDGTTSHTIFSRTGVTATDVPGENSNLAGPYTFADRSDPPHGGWWQAGQATPTDLPIPAGRYRTTASGGPGQTFPAPATQLTAAFGELNDLNGSWTLRLRDACPGDTASVSAASLRVAGFRSHSVTNTNDTGPGSLRAALEAASAHDGSDEITFAPGVEGEIVLASALPPITDPLVMTGPGPDELTVRANPTTAPFGVFTIEAAGAVSISGLTLTGGVAEVGGALSSVDTDLVLADVRAVDNVGFFGGGGIWVLGGSLSVKDGVVGSNRAVDDDQQGGGIRALEADVEIVDSVIRDNSLPREGYGAGIHLDGRSLRVEDSSIEGNSSTQEDGTGGAVYVARGEALLERTLVSGNSARRFGGVYGPNVTISDSTITGNAGTEPTTSQMSPGAAVAGDSVTISNSTIAGNRTTEGPANLGAGHAAVTSSIITDPAGGPNCGAGVDSRGYNLADDSSCALDGSHDQPSTEPRLGPLQDNGGPVWTMLPEAMSPALDAGSAERSTDARGETRPVNLVGVPNADDGADIGAVELQLDEVPAPEVTITSGPTGAINDPTPTFGFAAQNATVLECSVSQGAPAYGPCSTTASHTPAALADGSYEFRVRVTGASGATDSATRAFTLDATPPPAPQLTATNPPSPSNQAAIRVRGQAAAGSTVRVFRGADCSGSAAATGSAATFSGAGISMSVPENTTSQLRATATDGLGNRSACSLPLLYVEDSSPPQTTLTESPGDFTSETDVRFEFDSSEPNSQFRCNFGGGLLTPCTSPQVFNDLTDGEYFFVVVAIDQAGNRDPTAAGQTFTVDTQRPTAVIEHLKVRRAKRRIRASFSGSDNNTVADELRFLCQVRGRDERECESPALFKHVPRGRRWIKVWTVDLAGNRSVPAEARFRIKRRRAK